ncbi:MAG: 2-oxo acid dehydrogenase subunit E2 [Microthrixaceae bacterium]|nr:2-oxo acid dehydrogenase subunit E2 [Microthrixaceae bacterium]
MARITMPQLGETVTEGTVTRWLKAVGEHVEVDEALLEVSTDKVDTEIPSAFAGVVSSLAVAEGETVPIGALLAVIGDDEPDEPGATGSRAGEHRASRSFRKTMEGGLGSTQVPVTIPPPPTTDGGPSGIRRRPAPSGPMPSATVPVDETNVARRVPFSPIRRRTAQHLTASLHTAAHALVAIEVDYTAVEATRTELAQRWRATSGFGLTYLPFVARALCAALADFPLMNASVDGDELVVHRRVHLGIAVDLDHQGLVVPVVRDAGSLRTAELAVEIRSRASRARSRLLRGDDLNGGTFTLTNAGGYGTFVTAPIINPPQVGILSTDGVAMRPVAMAVAGGGYGVAVRAVGHLSLAFDHRAVDGAYAAATLARVRSVLEEHDWSAELSRIAWGPSDEAEPAP